MKHYFEIRLNKPLAFGLYQAYEQGEDSVLEELIAQLCPLIRCVFKTEIGPSQYNNQSILEANALEEVYTIVIKKELPDRQEPFINFLYTSIHNSMKKSILELTPKFFDFWQVCRNPVNSGISGFTEVDMKIYREQIQKAVYSDVKKKIRFMNNERKACILFLDSIMGIKKISPSFVKLKYNLKKKQVNYLFDYVKILVKSTMMEHLENERKSHPIAPQWERGRCVLCTPDSIW